MIMMKYIHGNFNNKQISIQLKAPSDIFNPIYGNVSWEGHQGDPISSVASCLGGSGLIPALYVH